MRIDPPDRLATRFSESSATWQQILDVDASALAVFSRISALSVAFATLSREALQRFGLNYAELSVLAMLRTTEPEQRRSPTELRALVGQSSAGTTRILDKLEADGHLRREDLDGGDRRRVDIVLTPSGAALAEQGVAALLTAETAVLRAIPAAGRAAIASSLDALLGAFATDRE